MEKNTEMQTNVQTNENSAVPVTVVKTVPVEDKKKTVLTFIGGLLSGAALTGIVTFAASKLGGSDDMDE